MPLLHSSPQFKAGTTALFDMLAQHPEILTAVKEPWHTWHEACPNNKARCVIKEVNGFTRIGERQRWNERGLVSRYHILPIQEQTDNRRVMEASPYYLSGMVDSFEDLTRFPDYIGPDVKVIALVRNPIDRAFSEYLMFAEPPFRGNKTGCGRGPSRARFEELAVEELAIASSRLLEDPTVKHRCLTESSKWQHVPLAAGRNGFKGRLLRWGEYHHYLDAWMRLLGPDQLAVVKNEDMDAEPDALLAELQQWLGVSVTALPPLHTNLAACRGSIARGAWDEKKKKEAKDGLCFGAGAWASQKRMDPGAIAALQRHFVPHNARLGLLTGQSFASWDVETSKYYLGAEREPGVDWDVLVTEAVRKGGRVSGAVGERAAELQGEAR